MVDMYYSYNAIFGCGVMNIFSAVIHLGCLCMKLSATKGFIAVYDDQDSARAAKSTTTHGQKMCTTSVMKRVTTKNPH